MCVFDPRCLYLLLCCFLTTYASARASLAHVFVVAEPLPQAYRLERPRAPLAKQHREERPSWPSPSSPAYAVVSEGGTSAERQDRPHRHEAPQIGTRRKWAVLGDGGGGDDEDPDGGANGEVLRDEESMDGAAVLLQAATPSVKVSSVVVFVVIFVVF